MACGLVGWFLLSEVPAYLDPNKILPRIASKENREAGRWRVPCFLFERWECWEGSMSVYVHLGCEGEGEGGSTIIVWESLRGCLWWKRILKPMQCDRFPISGNTKYCNGSVNRKIDLCTKKKVLRIVHGDGICKDAFLFAQKIIKTYIYTFVGNPRLWCITCLAIGASTFTVSRPWECLGHHGRETISAAEVVFPKEKRNKNRSKIKSSKIIYEKEGMNPFSPIKNQNIQNPWLTICNQLCPRNVCGSWWRMARHWNLLIPKNSANTPHTQLKMNHFQIHSAS